MFIRTLRAFLALHRAGTVVAAAEDVHLSQAAVSVQLKNLETELGLSLFARTKRSLCLTPTGRQLVPLAEQMVSIYEQMKRLDKDGPVAGLLSLGVINSAWTGVLPRLLKKITAGHPNLEIKVTAGISGDLVAKVDAGIVDAAIVTQPPRHFSTHLVAHHLYAEPFVLIAPAQMAFSDLATSMGAAPYVAFDRSAWAGQLIDEYLGARGLRVRPAMEVDSLDAIIAVVSHGLGVSIVPLILGANWHTSPALRIVRLSGFDRPVSLIERRQHLRSALTATVLASFEEIAAVAAP
ncbi:LysR family transcriptional regulator [Verminephrobacter eiseniae]|uniref:LysR family transcriptional regulator n=1 Tax=Verminephrobacter eiseniae TaxID=364317 RepID=UPI00223909E0|nr:LysR family transcriptional regulator [Verminephrobacter eiseniae]MCW5231468.1 LysR family transcriptional regulator [Verminephrobacter eiseniae]MCW5293197.1 LysR family transcriptional regulator [Verminephrobacter eiseniae]MCW8186575.1 LysR family transcriptional regulator [Verminephrobacter eiseniae]MCW8223949.1 LysR family transcriptional regulator [Verminephrobacter eiseniae]MCW8235710.1 LysR family transcriptional regulator [Verminephrobacter eiseniae]